MGARELLHDLAGAGLTLTADGARLVIRPASKLTDDMRAALREAKPELLALLAVGSPQFHARRDRLLRWGWPAPEAEALAERLARRDAVGDDRVSSAADCAHYRPGRCGNHRRAGLDSAEVGRDLAAMLQRRPAATPNVRSDVTPSARRPAMSIGTEMRTVGMVELHAFLDTLREVERAAMQTRRAAEAADARIAGLVKAEGYGWQSDAW